MTLRYLGIFYRTTPAHLGEEYIMVDEEKVSLAMRESFETDEIPDPDEDAFDKPSDVEIAVDDDGDYYAVMECLDGKYRRRCDDPNFPPEDGLLKLHGNVWERI